jgi:hypothetical protein
MAPKVEGSRTQKNKPPNVTKLVPKNPKNSPYIVLLPLKFKDDLKNSRWHSYRILNEQSYKL